MPAKDGPRWKPQIVGGKESSSSPPEKLSPEERLRRDIAYMAANPQVLEEFRQKGQETNEFLRGLTDYREPSETIRVRIEGLKEMAFEDIVGNVLNGHRLQWQQEPSFYLALLMEGKN